VIQDSDLLHTPSALEQLPARPPGGAPIWEDSETASHVPGLSLPVYVFPKLAACNC
jgi:hypothetical protein